MRDMSRSDLAWATVIHHDRFDRPDGALRQHRPRLRRVNAPMDLVRVLHEDADLASALTPAERLAAADVAVARELRCPAGPWEASTALDPVPGDLGLLILDGFVVRETTTAGRTCATLLDRGALIRPWEEPEADGVLMPSDVRWTVLVPLRVAVLDRQFAHAVCRWPGMVEALVKRSVEHSRWMAVLMAINSRPRIDLRLLALFAHLADRWGRVTAAGVVVPLPLTHALLATMVGARRPTVTTALSELSAAGLLERRGGTGWVLREPAAAPSSIAHIPAPAAPAA